LIINHINGMINYYNWEMAC